MTWNRITALGASLLLGLLLALAPSARVHAASVLPLDLDRIVGDATIAFQGTVTDTHAELDAQSGRIVTYVTFRVEDALKGPVGSTYKMKQVGGRLPSGESYRVDGVPGFTTGESYVVFLTGASSVGLSSPVGLAQGKFTIKPTGGTLEVANGRDFREMTANIPDAAIPPGARARLQQKAGGKVRSLGLDDFKQLVRQRIGAAR